MSKFNRNNIWVLLILLMSVACNKEAVTEKEDEGLEKGRFLDDWTYDVFIENNETSKNTYKLWIPEGIQPIAILVLSVGGLGNGTNLVKSQEWQAFAQEEKLALVGTYVSSNSEGSAQNLKFAVRQIAQARGLDNLLGLPYLLRGHSSGGRFSYIFSQVYNKSTLAWANIKGNMTNYNQLLPPGLFIVGEDDLESRNQSIKSAFLSQRKTGGLSVYALEPNAGHGGGTADPLIRSYFSAILDKTFDKDGNVSGIDTADIFLGDNQSLEIWTYANYPGIKEEASCLIDESFSAAWLEFIKG